MSLTSYIKDLNETRSMFRQELLTSPRTKKECRNVFSLLMGSLSPENLTCDGELSSAKVKSKFRKLRRAWETLELIYGEPVKESDAWNW